jgi:hypothetical protein
LIVSPLVEFEQERRERREMRERYVALQADGVSPDLHRRLTDVLAVIDTTPLYVPHAVLAEKIGAALDNFGAEHG